MDKERVKSFAIYEALIKKEFPGILRKKFTENVMQEIKKLDQQGPLFGRVLLQYASIFVFAVITLYVLNYPDNKIEYTRTNIDTNILPATENVSNVIDECITNEDPEKKVNESCK